MAFLFFIDEWFTVYLIEAKRLKQPYDEDEYFSAEKEVNKAVIQLNRRERVVQYDWDIIKKRSSIELPEKPPAPDKIIKIACLNIYDFTGLYLEGCYITDKKCLLRFFSDPDIYLGSVEKGVIENRILIDRLWEGESPTINDLRKYLREPFYIKHIARNITTYNRAYPVESSEEEKLFKMDYILTQNPYGVLSYK